MSLGKGESVSPTVVITGAFSYTGKYAARMLLERGYQIRTLTFHPSRENEFADRLEVHPYNFEQPDALARSLAGASTLINTYWVRFLRGRVGFETAVRNSRILIDAARTAGIERMVHVSIAHPDANSRLRYYRGKAEVEHAVRDSGMSYAIVRPTVIFGSEDILINNIAWFLRHFPVFGIPGNGRYRIRPIYVEDMARLLVDAAGGSGNSVLNAVGPETFSFDELVRLIRREVRSRCRVAHMPARLAYLATRMTGWWLRDVVLTWEEYLGLMNNLLAPDGSAAGSTRLSDWLARNRERVGIGYASEVARHF
jgi:uncharacterized protein YbjT (DUF2867 family)